MPLNHYGVLKGKPTQRIMAHPGNEHFQILIDDGAISHRIAINVKSKLSPPEVLFYMDHDYRHEITDAVKSESLLSGFSLLQSKPAGIAIDFIRRNMFDHTDMRAIPYNKPGADNDVNEKLDFYVSQAISDANAEIYAWGQKWGPENGKPDKYFHFQPGNGIHDIHMNQGNGDKYKKDNGVWQDGALMIHFPDRDQWIGVFIAFQVQSFHTDDRTGNPLTQPVPLPEPGVATPIEPTGVEMATPVRIIAAMVNPRRDDVGKEYVILLNKSDQDINLDGWKILDKSKVNADLIKNKIIPAGDTLKIILSGQGAQLSNKGGIITLLNPEGLKIDGTAYTKSDAHSEGEVLEL